MNIQISNIAMDVDESDLLTAFGPFGRVLGVSVRVPPAGQPERTAVVQMVRNEGRTAIAALHGTELKGQRISVQQLLHSR